jgi:uncharacterized membrane protein
MDKESSLVILIALIARIFELKFHCLVRMPKESAMLHIPVIFDTGSMSSMSCPE